MSTCIQFRGLLLLLLLKSFVSFHRFFLNFVDSLDKMSCCFITFQCEWNHNEFHTDWACVHAVSQSNIIKLRENVCHELRTWCVKLSILNACTRKHSTISFTYSHVNLRKWLLHIHITLFCCSLMAVPLGGDKPHYSFLFISSIKTSAMKVMLELWFFITFCCLDIRARLFN